MKLIKIKNTGPVKTWMGQTIQQNEYVTLASESTAVKWMSNPAIYTDIASGILVVNNGVDITDDLNAFEGWNWLSNIEKLPISTLDGIKLAVHSSSKPILDGEVTYAVWTGSGDHPVDGSIFNGDICELNLIPGTMTSTVDMKFDIPQNGRIWIHEGYLKFENGGSGDYIEAVIVAEPTPLQTAVNLDLTLTNNLIKYSAGGPGTGTHGFADPTKVVLIPRSYSKDGDWDYDGTNLTPNFTGTGGYRISDIETTVNRYMNKVPCRGTCNTYFSMTSDETAEILQNYFVRIKAHNVSNTTWFATIILEIFRERTYNP